MNERFAFMRSIIDAPEDDLPRLAFADWLQEHGELERGELIRVQVELAQNPARVRRVMLLDSQFELLSGNVGLRWVLKDLAPTGWFTSGAKVGVWNWHRGFVEELRCPSAEFFRFVDELYWRKTRVEKCLRCDGDGKAHGSDRPFEYSGPGTYPGPCPSCDGVKTLMVPQHCPETAQPIRKVTLTDTPQLIFTGDGHFTWEWYSCPEPIPAQLEHPLDNRGLERCLEQTFPGIEFTVNNG